jgi:two-component system KDP operon response regulator KdpE
MRILVVEDEPHMQRFLRAALTASGYDVLDATTGTEALVLIAEWAPDIVVLDLGLPDMDGKKLIRKIRARSPVPIIVISARDSEAEKILALDMGANDYLEKPFVIGEFMARVRTALRNVAHDRMIQAAGLVIDTKMRSVEKDGAAVKLTRTEYKLLVALARRAGEPLGHQEILKALWGARRPDNIEHLRVVVRQLRLKIEDDPSAPRTIMTAPGIGYVFVGMKP